MLPSEYAHRFMPTIVDDPRTSPLTSVASKSTWRVPGGPFGTSGFHDEIFLLFLFFSGRWANSATKNTHYGGEETEEAGHEGR